MNSGKYSIASLICFLFVAGCVSTTTGSITEPERDDEDAADLNYQLGVRYYRQESYELARDRLLGAIEINPRMAKAYSTLGMTYEKLENIRLATDAYEKSIRVAPRNFDVQNAYAVFLCGQKEYDKAVRHFDKAIAHPENDNSHLTMANAGICMKSKPDEDAAEAYFRAALDRKPGYGDALVQLCLMKFQQKDYLSARAFVQRFMATNVSTAGILYLASKIEDMLGNDRGRTEYEDQLIREFPTSPEARRVLGSS
jgi:type IV pilus assembly protein PilF